MNRFKLFSLLTLLATGTLFSCSKDTNSSPTPNNPSTPKRWIKVYRDVILGDDSNAVEGQFLDTRTGQVYKMQQVPDSLRKHLSLCYYVTQTGSYEYLTTTGSVSSTASGPSSSLIFTAPGYGINNWSAAEKNTFEIRVAGYGSPEMTPQEFDALAASGSWTKFNDLFKLKNNGGDYLGYVSGSTGLGNEIYLGEINNALRMIIYHKSSSQDPKTGFVKLDIIVEGRTDAPSGAAAIMPPQ